MWNLIKIFCSSTTQKLANVKVFNVSKPILWTVIWDQRYYCGWTQKIYQCAVKWPILILSLKTMNKSFGNDVCSSKTLMLWGSGYIQLWRLGIQTGLYFLFDKNLHSLWVKWCKYHLSTWLAHSALAILKKILKLAVILK